MQRDQFKYQVMDTVSRIAKAKKSFQRMKSKLANSHISFHTKRRALVGYFKVNPF